MLDTNDEIEYIVAADEMQELTMTSLGKLVFGDIHDRQNKIMSRKGSLFIDSLSLAYENMIHMPFDMIEMHSANITTLDISYNKFSRNLQFLAEFDNLTSLNLDHNIIDENTVFPYLPKLELLWLNHNSIETLYPFIKNLHESLPNLKYLCLMGNKAAPSYFNGGSFYDYLQYRLFVISWFPYLLHLDDRKITLDHRKEAKRLFKRPFFDDLSEPSAVPQCIRKLHNKIANIFVKPDKMPSVKLRVQIANTII